VRYVSWTHSAQHVGKCDERPLHGLQWVVKEDALLEDHRLLFVEVVDAGERYRVVRKTGEETREDDAREDSEDTLEL